MCDPVTIGLALLVGLLIERRSDITVRIEKALIRTYKKLRKKKEKK